MHFLPFGSPCSWCAHACTRGHTSADASADSRIQETRHRDTRTRRLRLQRRTPRALPLHTATCLLTGPSFCERCSLCAAASTVKAWGRAWRHARAVAERNSTGACGGARALGGWRAGAWVCTSRGRDPTCVYGVGCAAATTIPDQWRAARLRSAAGLNPFSVPPLVALSPFHLPARAGGATPTLSEADTRGK